MVWKCVAKYDHGVYSCVIILFSGSAVLRMIQVAVLIGAHILYESISPKSVYVFINGLDDIPVTVSQLLI